MIAVAVGVIILVVVGVVTADVVGVVIAAVVDVMIAAVVASGRLCGCGITSVEVDRAAFCCH